MASAMTSYQNTFAGSAVLTRQTSHGLTVAAMTEEEKAEVLSFLSARPIHTVCMSSFLRDNGVVSANNRGTFYVCRNNSGTLQGVALIGHATLFETKSDKALQAFASLKNGLSGSHLVRGEHKTVSRFWKYYGELGHQLRLARREDLFVKEKSEANVKQVSGLRLATLDQLDQLKHINAEFIRIECGMDPLQRDPVGFANRMATRIEKNRIWVMENKGELIFKADVFAQTPQAAYVEGVFVHPQYRRRGIGLSCLRDLSQRLLQQSGSLCLFINEQESELERFYSAAGYKRRSIYDTIYLNTEH